MPKTIVLTGASRGIGLAIAKYLVKERHNVFLVARTEEPMRKLKEENPGQVEFLVGDLGGFEVGPKAISLALAAFTTLDALIINHGVLSPVKRVADSTPEEWRSIYDINFFSALSFITPAIPHLRASHGHVLLTSSGASTGAYSTWGAYGSSKAALNHLCLTLSVEEPLITSISIRPGTVDTDMQADVRNNREVMEPKDVEKFRALYEEGRLLRPETPGNVIARLAVGGERELSGRFLSWDDKALEKYQDEVPEK